MNNGSNKFNYTYSAPTEQERREIDSIRRQYVSKDASADKLSQLRRLDGKVKNPPKILGIVFGVVGILVFGLGLTMVLEWSVIAWGIVVAAVGAVPMALAYPSYSWLLRRNKAKYGEQIIALSDELLSGENPKD